MSRKVEKKRRGNPVFLLLVISLYALAFLLDGQLALDALERAVNLLYHLLPALLLVIVLIFLTNLLIGPDWVHKHVGKESGFKGWIVAVVGGMFSVGPVYPWYALLGEMRNKGMRTALIAAFLYTRGIKLPLLPLMIYYFGPAFTLTLAVYLLLFSIIGGVAMEKLINGNDLPGGTPASK